MASIRWEPLEGLGILRKEMDRVIEDFFRGAPFQTRDRGTLEPAVDVWETPDTVVVDYGPGVSREHLHLTMTEDTLIIKGESTHSSGTTGVHLSSTRNSLWPVSARYPSARGRAE